MLNDAPGLKKIYLAAGYTDLRRGMDGLATIIRFRFQLDPYDKNTLFLLGGSFDLIGCLGRISSPCISIVYCSGDISNASSTERGQLKAPLLSLL